MRVINFDNEMEKIASSSAMGEKKKKLLLHSCCAPCSSACIERVRDSFDLTVYFYNPNMDSEREFNLRFSEQERLCLTLGVPLIKEDYNNSEFYSAVKGFEAEIEGGARCEKCFYLRLKKTAQIAKEKGFDYFSTTLTVSPLKNAKLINEIGFKIEQETGVSFLPCDFKKKGGYQRSIELSKEYNLYRQNYCGCEFSKG